MPLFSRFWRRGSPEGGEGHAAKEAAEETAKTEDIVPEPHIAEAAAEKEQFVEQKLPGGFSVGQEVEIEVDDEKVTATVLGLSDLDPSKIKVRYNTEVVVGKTGVNKELATRTMVIGLSPRELRAYTQEEIRSQERQARLDKVFGTERAGYMSGTLTRADDFKDEVNTADKEKEYLLNKDFRSLYTDFQKARQALEDFLQKDDWSRGDWDTAEGLMNAVERAKGIAQNAFSQLKKGEYITM